MFVCLWLYNNLQLWSKLHEISTVDFQDNKVTVYMIFRETTLKSLKEFDKNLHTWASEQEKSRFLTEVWIKLTRSIFFFSSQNS